MAVVVKKFPNSLKAAKHLSKVDLKLASLIKEVGPVRIDIDRGEEVFESLLRSIVYQQLHGKAAATILARYLALFGKSKKFPTPKKILTIDEAAMRTVGLSRNKALAILDLAAKVLDGTVPNRTIAEKMTDEELIEAFSKVRGIGVWTAQMLLIFTLARPDVLPTGDYGVRRGYALLYGKKKLPTPKQMEVLCANWKPHASVAAWYMWRVTELERFKKIKFKA